MSADIRSQLLASLEAAGIGPRNSADIVLDGKLHRYHIRGDSPGSKNGWYVLYTDGMPAGAFGSWKHGVKECWRPEGPPPTAEERARAERLLKAAQEKERRAREQTQERTATKCQDLWSRSEPANADHPYLVRKRVQPHGLRQSAGQILVPLRDIEGQIFNLQRIFPDGQKRFVKGGRVKGLFSPLGDLGSPASHVICEGWATAATLHETTGKPVLAALNAGNLMEVCKAARAKWPDADIIVAADNDRFTRLPDGRENPGVTYAKAAAATIGARLAIPPFPEGCKGTDFNDLHCLRMGAGT